MARSTSTAVDPEPEFGLPRPVTDPFVETESTVVSPFSALRAPTGTVAVMVLIAVLTAETLAPRTASFDCAVVNCPGCTRTMTDWGVVVPACCTPRRC